MKVKVCGIKEPDNMALITSLEVDYIGWIFHPQSPRFVAAEADRMHNMQRNGKAVVGVFVNQTEDDILAMVETCKLDMVQLHGIETNDLCRSLSEHVEVIKAVHISSPQDLQACDAFPDADYLLLEARNAHWGGLGQQFDWDLLTGYDAVQPFFLSGGIGPNDVDRLVGLRHPQLMGIDINSRFEDAPGIKNIPLVSQFITTLKRRIHGSHQ